MREISQELIVLTAAFLHVPAKRRRGLLLGNEQALAEWLERDTSRKVAHARHQAREAHTALSRDGARLVLCTDPTFPSGLADLTDTPAFIIVRGTLPRGGIAIVGTREPSHAAARLAHNVAQRCQHAVISGLAHGIDAAAHGGALAGGNATIAYVATGTGVTYPPSHKKLEDTIVARGGGIATERLPNQPAAAWAFVQRDRLQAAHARAVLLVASELDGGAMHTMRFAQQLRRPRFAVVGGEFAFAGNALALAHGAQPLPPDAEKIVDALQRVV